MNVGLLVTLLVGGLGLGGTLGYFFGIDQGQKQAVSSFQVSSDGDEQNPKLLLVEGEVYTVEDLPTELQTRLYDLEQESYSQKEALLKEFALRLALAPKDAKNASLDELPPLEDLLDKPDVSDEEMKEFYEQNKNRLPPNTSFDDIKGRLEQFLANQKSAEVFQETWNKMADAGELKMLVAAPRAPLVSIPIEDFPKLGENDAPYTLVEVSDYLCPHCQTVHPQVKEAVEELDDKVQLVQINFSLRPDKLSGSLVEGAYCAQQQGTDAFWKYHDVAFEGDWGSMNDGASKETAQAVAKKAGLDVDKIKTCLESDAPEEFKNKAREVATSLGVTGTPTFFLNNRRLSLKHGGELTKAIKEHMTTSQRGS
jgi:protein-disulfide isomerase